MRSRSSLLEGTCLHTQVSGVTPRAARRGPPLVWTEAVAAWGRAGRAADVGCSAPMGSALGLDGGGGLGARFCWCLGPRRLGLCPASPARWVGWFGFLFLPTPFSLRPVPPSQPSPSHWTGARPRPSSAPSSPAAASSNEHLPCFRWAGAAVAAAARAGCGCCRLRIMMTGECVCVPGPDELVGIHLKTCVGYSGRMVTDSLCGWF